MASDNSGKNSIKGGFGGGKKKRPSSGLKPVMFEPDDIFIRVEKTFSKEAWIAYDRTDIDMHAIERLEYNPNDYTVDVTMNDESVWDLGVIIPWQIRAYFARAKEVEFVRTKNQEKIETRTVPMTHKPKDPLFFRKKKKE